MTVGKNDEKTSAGSAMRPGLAQLFTAHRGKLTDKWAQYLGMYEAELKSLVDEGAPVILLEVGVQNGGSLELWSKYLPPNSTVFGIDIAQEVGKLQFDSQTRVFVADATDSKNLESILNGSRPTIIIDDGSHQATDVLATIKILFPILAPGGKYIIEDVHASYWSSHGGGFRNPDATVEKCKNWIDGLNFDYFAEGDCSADERAHLAEINRSVSRIGFYDAAIVLDKQRTEKIEPHARIFGGTQFDVCNPIDGFLGAPASAIAPMRFTPAAVEALNLNLFERLQGAEARILELESELAEVRSAKASPPA